MGTTRGYDPIPSYDESGSFNTTTCVTDNGNVYLVFEWNLDNQYDSQCQSVISWTLKGRVARQGYTVNASNINVVINGKTV